jgi:hypothetical protein
MEVKSGARSTEFWVTLLVQFVSVFLFANAGSGSEPAQDALTKGATALGALIANALVVVHYLKSRTQLKAAAIMAPSKSADSSSIRVGDVSASESKTSP